MYIVLLALYKKYTYISFKGRKENQLLSGVFLLSHTPAVLYILQPEGGGGGGGGGGRVTFMDGSEQLHGLKMSQGRARGVGVKS